MRCTALDTSLWCSAEWCSSGDSTGVQQWGTALGCSSGVQHWGAALGYSAAVLWCSAVLRCSAAVQCWVPILPPSGAPCFQGSCANRHARVHELVLTICFTAPFDVDGQMADACTHGRTDAHARTHARMQAHTRGCTLHGLLQPHECVTNF